MVNGFCRSDLEVVTIVLLQKSWVATLADGPRRKLNQFFANEKWWNSSCKWSNEHDKMEKSGFLLISWVFFPIFVGCHPFVGHNLTLALISSADLHPNKNQAHWMSWMLSQYKLRYKPLHWTHKSITFERKDSFSSGLDFRCISKFVTVAELASDGFNSKKSRFCCTSCWFCHCRYSQLLVGTWNIPLFCKLNFKRDSQHLFYVLLGVVMHWKVWLMSLLRVL